MVEAWRLHKQPLYEIIPAGTQIHVFFLFTGTKMPAYQEVLPVMLRAIAKLISEHQQLPAQPSSDQDLVIPPPIDTLPTITGQQ
jgi:hypothetical protein